MHQSVFNLGRHASYAPGGFDDRSSVPVAGLLSLLSHSRLLAELGSRESPRCSRRNSQVRQRSDSPLHHRPRPVPPPDLHQEQGSAGVFRPGLPDDVRVRAPRRDPLVPRSVEARSRVRDLLLGRRLGVGLVPERPDVGRSVAVRVRRHAEGDQPAATRRRRTSARSSTRSASATSRISRPKRARNRTRPTPTRWPRSRRSIPNDLDAITLYADALFLLEPRRGTRDVNAPNIKRLHGVLESALKIDPKHPGACHLYVHATESTVRPELAVEPARNISARPFPAPATSTTCRRTPGTKWDAGAIRSRPIPKRGIRT